MFCIMSLLKAMHLWLPKIIFHYVITKTNALSCFCIFSLMKSIQLLVWAKYFFSDHWNECTEYYFALCHCWNQCNYLNAINQFSLDDHWNQRTILFSIMSSLKSMQLHDSYVFYHCLDVYIYFISLNNFSLYHHSHQYALLFCIISLLKSMQVLDAYPLYRCWN